MIIIKAITSVPMLIMIIMITMMKIVGTIVIISMITIDGNTITNDNMGLANRRIRCV